MSDPTQPPDGAGSPRSAPRSPEASIEAGSDVVLDGPAPPGDDTPTIISRIQPRPNGPDNLYSSILRGRTLAHFELIESIGVGGMAAVLRARDTQLERIVALKILPPEMAADPENVARFRQEARAAARLDHETIARVYFCGEDQNLHFIAFEFVEGDNLRTVIDRRGPLPAQEALHYMLQVATGLAHAAERGVVHRDIKPSNIIISPNGRAKLVDMGLARNLGPPTDNDLTQSGVTLGTFDYISPEQALEPREADARSDMYSLGCTFYHVLTGQAPVPEGTAAKKLHHHQHVPPIDPRQLNPDVPDEVAAILGRMMAKDPRHRYQRPEHLVQHLLQATQRLGSGVEGPGGVLFVDAALPAPPRARPLLVIGCAAAIVVALVVLVGPSRRDFRFPGGLGGGGEQKQAAENPPNPPAGGGQAGGPVVENGGTPKTGPEAPRSEPPILQRVDSWSTLAKFGRTTTDDKSYNIVVTGDLRAEPGDLEQEVVLRGKSIAVMGEGATLPTVWSRYVAADRTGGLRLEAETVELRRLRVVADANSNTPGQLFGGVVIKAARRVLVSQCEFLQGTGGATSPFISSVAVQPLGAARPSVAFEQCCFLGAREVNRPAPMGMGGDGWLTKVSQGGQTAVVAQGVASVSATDCAFGPHASLFRFSGQGTTANLAVRHCTAMAGDEWALAHLGDDTAVAVRADDCLFGRVTAPAMPPEGGMTMMGDRRPTVCLVRYDAGARRDQSSYAGTSNRYLNIDALWLPAGADAAAVSTPFAEQIADGKERDDRVLPPGANPWKEKDRPLALFEGGALRPEELLAAFRLDFSNVPALTVLEPDPRSGPTVAGVGMEKSPWGPEWTKDDLAAPGSAPAGKKVVDPNKSDTARGIYPSLDAALSAAKAGDEIRIRHTGELVVGQSPRIKSGVSVTIKPDGETYRPVLVLDKDPDRQAALFRVQGGQLTLESLEFRLRPKDSRCDSQAVALLGGEGSVAFKDCVVTLDGRDAAVPLAVVMLPDYKDAMLQPGAPGMPKIVFETSFVRGDGDLVSARASRPFEMDVKESLVALKGSLLNVDTGAKDSSAAAGKETVRLDRVTAYLGGHLAHLKAPRLSGLMPVHCTPVKSLLVSAGDRKAMLHIEAGPTKAPDVARELMHWSGEGNNYANFSPMLDQQPGDNEGSFPATNEEWKAADNGSKSDDVKFPERLWPDPASEVSLADVSAAAFDPKAGPKNVGVSTSKLPGPAENSP